MSYPGSKAQAGTWQRIIGQMPFHRCYIEPFFGSGVIYRRKFPAANSIVIDRNAKCLGDIPHSDAIRPLLGNALELLPNIPQVWNRDTLVYCDPPYVLSTRQNRFYYDHEMDDDAHCSLLALLNRLPCFVMLSGYPSDIYRQRLEHWRCDSYRVMTRGGERTECLWMNFPEPEILHDWRYAGKNYRERTRLTRLKNRWLRKLDNMKPRDRGYVEFCIEQRRNERCVPAPSAESGAT